MIGFGVSFWWVNSSCCNSLTFLNPVDSTKTGFTTFDLFAGCGAVCCLAWLGVIVADVALLLMASFHSPLITEEKRVCI